MSTWQSNLIQIGETGDQLYSGITKYVFSDSFVHCFLQETVSHVLAI